MAELIYPDVNHHAPQGAPEDYRTFAITQPTDQTVIAACHEVGCERWRNGWDSTVDERTPSGKLQAWAIRTQSGRTIAREFQAADGRTVFRFAGGQRCFENHRTRRQLFRVRDGDWRGNPTGRGRVHVSGRDWVEDMQENQGRLIELRQRG